MTQLFYHNVGLAGSADFDKTVFKEVEVATICNAIPAPDRWEAMDQLERLFPSGTCSAWGVPKGAVRVIAQLAPDDIVLLIRTVGVGGDMPALCQVKLFLPTPQYHLSELLWGPDRFPYIFFFRTERIALLWSDFKEHMGYLPNYRPQGLFYSVAAERLWRWGSAEAYAEFLRHHYRPLALDSMQLGMPQVARPSSLPTGRAEGASPPGEAWVGPELDAEPSDQPEFGRCDPRSSPGDALPDGRYAWPASLASGRRERTA